jgi:hypothetical protein
MQAKAKAKPTSKPTSTVQANTVAPVNGLTALVQQAVNNVTAPAPVKRPPSWAICLPWAMVKARAVPTARLCGKPCKAPLPLARKARQPLPLRLAVAARLLLLTALKTVGWLSNSQPTV